MKKILCILETAYRGTQEEQDDAALWLTHSLKNAGGDMGVLLRGNAVNYAIMDQDPTGITIGKIGIERPLYPDRALLDMKAAAIPVHVVQEDVQERGIPTGRLIKDVELVSRARIPGLLSQYDQVWHW
ncbi:MAG: hypothetical protein V3U86_02260 [Acidobacteriota bacterium]